MKPIARQSLTSAASHLIPQIFVEGCIDQKFICYTNIC